MNKNVIVLDSDGSFLNVTTYENAVLLIVKNKAVGIEFTKRTMRNENLTIMVPKVLRLKNKAEVNNDKKILFNNKNVFLRDNYTCVYCGKSNLKGIDCTLDHVYPKSKGGESTFENTVCSCKHCNNTIKGDLLLEECDLNFLDPKFKPFHPTFKQFLKLIKKYYGVNLNK